MALGSISLRRTKSDVAVPVVDNKQQAALLPPSLSFKRNNSSQNDTDKSLLCTVHVNLGAASMFPQISDEVAKRQHLCLKISVVPGKSQGNGDIHKDVSDLISSSLNDHFFNASLVDKFIHTDLVDPETHAKRQGSCMYVCLRPNASKGHVQLSNICKNLFNAPNCTSHKNPGTKLHLPFRARGEPRVSYTVKSTKTSTHGMDIETVLELTNEGP